MKPIDREELKRKVAEAIDKVANDFTDGYCPTPYEMTSESDCLEFAEAALSVFEEAGLGAFRNMSRNELDTFLEQIRRQIEERSDTATAANADVSLTQNNPPSPESTE